MDYPDKLIEAILTKFQLAIGKDMLLYKNHVYRVYLNCLIIDHQNENKPKYAIAAAFHDIGIWTDQTFDYLNPSIKQAKQYLTETDQQEWIEDISSMIYWHHKISKYKGKGEVLVESFRKADWIDVSFGLKTFGFDRTQIRQNLSAMPDSGFHRFLLRQSLGYFFKRPLSPLPMFKK